VSAPVTDRESKSITGIVTSDKMQKTRAVEVVRLERHPKYGKFVKRRTSYKVHDEKEVSHIGDTVRIVETRPLSKTKRWRLVEIITRSRYAGVAAVELSDVPSPNGSPARTKEGGPQS
jgi:small subunit ribosomal protein S17